MKKITLLFPHQLFEENPVVKKGQEIYLVEEHLFFRQYTFHKTKIVFQRAAMKCCAAYLEEKGLTVHYTEAIDPLSDVRQLIPHLKESGVTHIEYLDPVDNWLGKRLENACREHELKCHCHPTPLFLNTQEDITSYFEGRKRFFQTDFYIHQRKQRNVLVDSNAKPQGGKWSFDSENRLKYPKSQTPPRTHFPETNAYWNEALAYVRDNFSENYGTVDSGFRYPVTFEEARSWLDDFLQHRFHDFGPYEDAIVHKEVILHHSLLSPLLNTGLLTPGYVLQEALHFAGKHQVPLNSLEGFVRQIMGWREFIRAVYVLRGTEERTRNFWGFTRKIPQSFWTGDTGIPPIDITIRKVLKTGYCHHIERLMVLGNFMLLCGFDPREVYRWFMELFIDAWDWVMVPNVYGMSQFADGGIFATKPYISGSNYLMKMSDYPKGDWQKIWDGLFWRFLYTHHDFFSSNPRLNMLLKTFERMPREKQEAHLQHAETFLKSLDEGN